MPTWWSPLGFALLCGHCALGGVAVLLAATGLSFTLFGLDLRWVAPPVLILGGFGAYLWSGRRAACDVPAGEGPGHR